jgi:four helix bundle protein
MGEHAEGDTAVSSYRDLRVWQVAMDLAVESYRLGELLPSRERFGLVAQLRRAATSVPANIAEGHARLRRGEYLHYLSIARGSLKEVETLLDLSERLTYTSRSELAHALELCDFVSRMLTRLRRSLHAASAARARRPAPANLPPLGPLHRSAHRVSARAPHDAS